MQKFTTLCALAATLLVPAAASAQTMTYAVNRTIGGGTVVGSVVTDGTVGILTGANILNWEITLTSPNLNAPGGVDFLTGVGAFVQGNSLVASTSELTFDFGGNDTGFLVQGASGNGWCMASGPTSCAGEATPSEIIFFDANFNAAEAIIQSGVQTIATAVATVPEPATATLLLLAMAGLGVTARRRSRAA